MPRPRLLLTGFGPFPGAPRNPTAEIVGRLARRADLGSRAEVVARVLPVTWAAIAAFPDAIAEIDPDALLLLGLARRAREIRVERFAAARAQVAAVDAAGMRPPVGGLADGGPPRRAVTAPARAIAGAIAATGRPVRLSDDAGGYLCNALLRRALATAGDRPVAFLHLPASADVRAASRFRLADLERAVAAAIPPLLAALRD